MRFVEVLKTAEAANGAGSKKVIQEALATLDKDGRKLMRLAMDPYTVYHVKKYPWPTHFAGNDNDYGPIYTLLEELAARNLTGNAARNAVTSVLGQYSEETATYLARVIDKDVKAGFSADTFNAVLLAKALNMDVAKFKKLEGSFDQYKHLPEHAELIPTFECQLAEKCETEEEFEQYVTFPCQGDIKYDGARQFALVTDEVRYMARGGKPSDHLQGIFDEELLELRQQYGCDFVLDGEVMARTFEETMNAKGGKNADAKKQLIWRAFFIMPMTDWIAQQTKITNRQARLELTTLLRDKKKIMLTEGRMVNSFIEMKEYCNAVIDDETKTKAEREGLILKNLDAVYEWDRSFTWVKVKRFYDVDARIVGFYEPRKGTRLEKLGLIGGVNCIAFLESGEEVRFNVGSGFNHKHRKDMRENPDWWLKNTHVISYQEVSRSKGKDFASLRFCTYTRTRDDKLVEI